MGCGRVDPPAHQKVPQRPFLGHTGHMRAQRAGRGSKTPRIAAGAAHEFHCIRFFLYYYSKGEFYIVDKKKNKYFDETENRYKGTPLAHPTGQCARSLRLPNAWPPCWANRSTRSINRFGLGPPQPHSKPLAGRAPDTSGTMAARPPRPGPCSRCSSINQCTRHGG